MFDDTFLQKSFVDSILSRLPKSQPSLTLDRRLIERGVSHLRIEGKIYKVTVEEVKQ